MSDCSCRASGRLGSTTESDSAILNSIVAEEDEGEGEEGSSAPASNQHTLGMQQNTPKLSSVKLTSVGLILPQACKCHDLFPPVEGAWTAYRELSLPVSLVYSCDNDSATACLQHQHALLCGLGEVGKGDPVCHLHTMGEAVRAGVVGHFLGECWRLAAPEQGFWLQGCPAACTASLLAAECVTLQSCGRERCKTQHRR